MLELPILNVVNIAGITYAHALAVALSQGHSQIYLAAVEKIYSGEVKFGSGLGTRLLRLFFLAFLPTRVIFQALTLKLATAAMPEKLHESFTYGPHVVSNFSSYVYFTIIFAPHMDFC